MFHRHFSSQSAEIILIRYIGFNHPNSLFVNPAIDRIMVFKFKGVDGTQTTKQEYRYFCVGFRIYKTADSLFISPYKE